MPQKGHGTKLGRKQEQAIHALMTQRTVEEAARSIGIGVKTLYRWMQLPEFQQEYRKARREAFGQATARIQQTSAAAVSLLRSVIADSRAPAASRVRAAVFVMEAAAKTFELEDVEMRLTRLELLQKHED
jgi:transposase-like protein